MKKIVFSLVFLFCCSIYMYGQSKVDILNQGTTSNVDRTCTTDQRHQQAMQDPVFAAAYNQMRQQVAQQTANALLPPCTTPTIIPVVVHFQSTTISNQCMIDATIAQIDQMNLDFAGCNSNAGMFCDWIAAGCDNFGGTAGADAQAVDGSCFQFCLADQNLPADGNLIAGGVAITTGYNGNNQNAPALWNGYLNIYVANLGGGILGFVNFLGGASNTNTSQGASVLTSAFGGQTFTACEGVGGGAPFDGGATLTHEVGHWFGLAHTFSDAVADTPPQTNPNFGCPTIDLVNCTTSEGADYNGNFMDYVDDDCMFLFTEDQVMIMQATVAAQADWAINSVSCMADYPSCPQQGACVVACPTAVTTMLDLTNDYCGESTDTAFPDPEASGIVLDDNSDAVYSWSTGGYLSAGGTAVAAPAILTSANCMVETETYYLNVDCGTTPLAAPLDAGTWVITAYPGIPADISTLVMVSGEGSCGEPMVMAIAGCENYVTVTPDAANPTFPVNAGDMGTASYTVTFVPNPAGPDCCNPPAPGGEVIVNGDFEAGPGPDWAEIEESPIGTPVTFGIVGGTGTVNGSNEGWFGGWGGDSFTSITQNITIDPACTAANLTFDYNFTECGTATLEVIIGGVVVGTLPCTVGAGTFGPVEVIGAGAPTGATTISIEVIESGGGNSNLFVDNVSLITECPVEVVCDVVVTGDYNCDATCAAMASMISTTDPTRICIDGVGDPINVSIDTDGGATGAWVITDAAGIILALPPAPPFDLDGAGAGQCLIWYVNFDDAAFAPMVGDDAAAIVAASDCAILSNPITVDRIEVTAPTISTTDPTTICVDGVPDPINVTTDDAGVGANTAWVITDAAGMILALPAGPPFDLDGAGVGTCLIWLVNYDDPAFAPAVGDDAAAAVAAATCAALSNSITVVREDCVCEDAISGTVTLGGCDFTGTEVTIYDDTGAAVGTAMTDAMGNYSLAGPFECGAYTAELTAAPACYVDEGGDIGPGSFTVNGDGTADGYSFVPIPDNIPTVGEWGLIILGLMMSIVAIIGIRERKTAEMYS